MTKIDFSKINIFEFYLFVIQWCNFRLNLGDDYNDYKYPMVMWIIRGVVAVVLVIILVLSLSLSGLIAVLQIILIYVLLELLSTTIVYFITSTMTAYRDEINNLPDPWLQVLLKPGNSNTRDLMDSYNEYTILRKNGTL